MTQTPKRTRKPVAKKATGSTAEKAAAKSPPAAASMESVEKTSKSMSDTPPASPATTRRAGPWVGVIVVLIMLSIVITGAVASRDIWWPYAAPYIPKVTPKEDPRVATLMARLGALEEKVQATESTVEPEAATFEELEQARAKLSAEIATVIGRLETVEKSMDSVERMAAAVSSETSSAGAGQSLQVLVDRVNTLAQSTDLGPVVERLDNLEQQNSATKDSLSRESQLIEDMKRRMDSLEAERLGVETGLSSGASALILAVGQLREAVRQGRSFTTELNNAVAVAPGYLDADTAIAVLQSHAETGVATRAELNASFADTATAILRMDRRMEGDGWVSEAVNRLTSLVTIRRVDSSAAAGSIDARIARAEANLAVGDLAAAIDVLGGLTGPGAAAAAPWLMRAQASAVVHQALSDLNSVAITQLSAGQE